MLREQQGQMEGLRGYAQDNAVFLSIQSVFYCGDHRNMIGDVDGMYVRI